ncbi:hypothetical protein GGR56DRAFT_247062 [Xylariaceae sp. FL0804]|nr:hypothetical protein GGR56DRAFT_247062 [Xylariaceae sp. FL0804]
MPVRKTSGSGANNQQQSTNAHTSPGALPTDVCGDGRAKAEVLDSFCHIHQALAAASAAEMPSVPVVDDDYPWSRGLELERDLSSPAASLYDLMGLPLPARDSKGQLTSYTKPQRVIAARDMVLSLGLVGDYEYVPPIGCTERGGCSGDTHSHYRDCYRDHAGNNDGAKEGGGGGGGGGGGCDRVTGGPPTDVLLAAASMLVDRHDVYNEWLVPAIWRARRQNEEDKGEGEHVGSSGSDSRAQSARDRDDAALVGWPAFCRSFQREFEACPSPAQDCGEGDKEEMRC